MSGINPNFGNDTGVVRYGGVNYNPQESDINNPDSDNQNHVTRYAGVNCTNEPANDEKNIINTIKYVNWPPKKNN